MNDLCNERTVDLSSGRTHFCEKPKGHIPTNEHAAPDLGNLYTWSVHPERRDTYTWDSVCTCGHLARNHQIGKRRCTELDAAPGGPCGCNTFELPRSSPVRARADADGTAKPLTEIAGVFPAGKKNFYDNAVELIARPTQGATGTFECPICGRDTPHEHDWETVACYRDAQIDLAKRTQRTRELVAVNLAVETANRWARAEKRPSRWKVYLHTLGAALANNGIKP